MAKSCAIEKEDSCLKQEVYDLEKLNAEFDEVSWRIIHEKDPEKYQELVEQRSEISQRMRVLAEQIRPNAPQNTH